MAKIRSRLFIIGGLVPPGARAPNPPDTNPPGRDAAAGTPPGGPARFEGPHRPNTQPPIETKNNTLKTPHLPPPAPHCSLLSSFPPVYYVRENEVCGGGGHYTPPTF